MQLISRPWRAAFTFGLSAWVSAAQGTTVYRCPSAGDSGARWTYQAQPCAGTAAPGPRFSQHAIDVSDERTDAQRAQAESTLKRQLRAAQASATDARPKSSRKRQAKGSSPAVALSAHTAGERPFEHVEKASALGRARQAASGKAKLAARKPKAPFEARAPRREDQGVKVASDR